MSRLSGMYAERDIDFASISAGDHQSSAVPVPGAKLGDFVWVSVSSQTSDVLFDGHVNVDGQVRINAYNISSGAIDLGSRTFRVKVVPKDAI